MQAKEARKKEMINKQLNKIQDKKAKIEDCETFMVGDNPWGEGKVEDSEITGFGGEAYGPIETEKLSNPWIENGHNNVNAREEKSTMVDIESDEFVNAVVKVVEAFMDAEKHKKKLKKAQKKYDKIRNIKGR